MYLDCLSAIFSQTRLNPIMQRAKNDRSVLRALPVYDNDNMVAAHSESVAQEIVPNRIGKDVNIFASNWWTKMAF